MNSVPPSAAAREAMKRVTERSFNSSFTGSFSKTSNARKNMLALKKMSQAERDTGMTVTQLAEHQRELREDAARRRSA